MASSTEEPLNRIHVNNLAWSIKEDDLQKKFEQFGEIEKVKIPTRPKGGSKGFGFITFTTNEAAKNAVEEMNNVPLENRRIGVVFSTSVEKKKDKPFSGDEQESNRLVVRQLAWAVKNKQLAEAFDQFGKNTHKVMKAKNGKSKGFGFVTYETVEAAKMAKDEMNGKEIEGRAITVHFSNSSQRKNTTRKKDEVNEEDKGSSKPQKRNKNRKGKKSDASENKEKKRKPRSKLWVKISTETTEEDVKDVFAAYGAVRKVDVPKDSEGVPRGHAYVLFEDEEDANRALEDSKAKELKGVCFESDWARQNRRFTKRRNRKN